VWRLPSHHKDSLRDILARLYGEENRDRLLERLALVSSRYFEYFENRAVPPSWDQRDSLLITYGDMIRQGEEPPLRSLQDFLEQRLSGVLSGVHILPFFPYSSDDGFSVIDYNQVDPNLGDWSHIRTIADQFTLMADLVLNHCSAKSGWFKNYTNCVAPHRGYFVEADPEDDLSAVVRPRTSPLLTPVATPAGLKHVWTTFSADQVDLDFRNPEVLFEMLDVLLGYVANGARILRLDAIAYLWKEPGTDCINLPQTHEVVRLIRAVLDMLAPGAIVLTETNLPHDQNVSYFGAGDEAHMVYQFSLPPLLLHTLLGGDGSALQAWAGDLEPPPKGCTYLNFTASHDGIGVRPLEGLVSEADQTRLVAAVRERGGLVSSRRLEDGGEKPYELNITYFDALGDPHHPGSKRHIDRYLCSQAIMLALRGIPAVYFHSLMGARNDLAGVQRTDQPRSINRGRWVREELDCLLDSADSVEHQVFQRYRQLLTLRREQPAFHPDGSQQVLNTSPALFSLRRVSPDGAQSLVALNNLTARRQRVTLAELDPTLFTGGAKDLIGGHGHRKQVELSPYQSAWLLPMSS